LTRGSIARQIRLDEQYHMADSGDIARRLALNMHPRTSSNGGHSFPAAHHDSHHYTGRISPAYVAGSIRLHYGGPSCYPQQCWYPKWSHWVGWSWHFDCGPLFDPRPIWCRPVTYFEAPVWVYYEHPVWTALPIVSCGTWVDVAPVVVDTRSDLQLLAVRFVDPGHPEEKLGPRYRIWVRNNSDEPVSRPFNVVVLASPDGKLRGDLPQAGVRVTAIEAGDTQSLDVRLPMEVLDMGRDQWGDPVPFGTLHVIVDADREISEVFEGNNGADLARERVLPVDPAAFELEPSTARGGDEVLLAGEGFGPEPGQVLVHLGNVEMQAEILGWYDLGVRLALPALPLAGPADAEIIVIRDDGAAANPLQITITPPDHAPELLPAPPDGR
jgi:hypothetical protein